MSSPQRLALDLSFLLQVPDSSSSRRARVPKRRRCPARRPADSSATACRRPGALRRLGCDVASGSAPFASCSLTPAKRPTELARSGRSAWARQHRAEALAGDGHHRACSLSAARGRLGADVQSHCSPRRPTGDPAARAGQPAQGRDTQLAGCGHEDGGCGRSRLLHRQHGHDVLVLEGCLESVGWQRGLISQSIETHVRTSFPPWHLTMLGRAGVPVEWGHRHMCIVHPYQSQVPAMGRGCPFAMDLSCRTAGYVGGP